MEQREDRIYFARRAAEEQELALAAIDPQVAETHRKLQRATSNGQARARGRRTTPN